MKSTNRILDLVGDHVKPGSIIMICFAQLQVDFLTLNIRQHPARYRLYKLHQAMTRLSKSGTPATER